MTNEIAKNRGEIENIKSLLQVSNGMISNQLSGSQHSLSVLSIIFTCIGILIAVILPIATWYIRRLASQVGSNLAEANRILTNITHAKTDVLAIQTDVNAIQDTIKNNLSALYQSLQDEEVKSIFAHLEKEPSDLQHFFPKLTTNKFTANYFETIKAIYFKVKKINSNSAECAIALLSQNYPTESLNDSDLLVELKLYLVSTGLYISEIPAYHSALCTLVKDKNINDYIDLFSNSIEGLELQANPEVFTETTLKIWNDKLSNDHKKILIDMINAPGKFKQFKVMIPKWDELLKI